MSSIYGAWRLDGGGIPKNAVQLITAKTNWWDADAVDVYYNKNIFLGKASLLHNNYEAERINFDANTGLRIVADARLDNRDALIKLLKVTDKLDDARLILEAYLRFGFDCLKYLKGAFVFVIWNKSKQQIFAARDQIGVKPLNFYFKDNLFLFGTQKKSILHFPDIQFRLNWDNIVQRVEGRPFVPNHTEYLDINRLEPAHYLVVDRSGLTKVRYWELNINKPIRYQNENDYVEHFLELFKEAVKVRMNTKNRIASHVSGGFDSGAIAAVAQSIANESNKKIYGIGYTRPQEVIRNNQERVDESDYVDDITKHIGLNECIKVNKPIDRTREEKVYYEQQICDGFQLGNKVNNEFEILIAARNNNISTILSGFPGDELISYHYYSYQFDYLAQRKYWDYLKDPNGVSMKRKVKFWYYRFLKNSSNIISSSVKRHISKTRQSKVIEEYAKNSYILDDRYSSNLNNALYKSVNADIFSQIFNSNADHQKFKIGAWPVSYRMESEHLVGLNFKVDYRYPLADLRLLEYTVNLPSEQRWDGKTHRLFFKNVCKKLLPLDFVNKEKTKGVIKPMLKHFGVPKDDTIQNLWLKLLRMDLIKFMDTQKVQKLIDKKSGTIKLSKYFLIASLGEKFNLDI